MGHHDASTEPPNHLARRLERATGVRVARCYQCGKCTAGCPVADEMDETPSRLLRLLQTERPEHERRALASRAIWVCLGCETCVSRCPNEVDVPRAIDHLRSEAIAAGLAHRDARDILAFHRAFLATIGGRGRLYELELIARYKLTTGRLLQDVVVAPSMFAKGKIGLLPHRVHDPGTSRVFEAAAERRTAAKSNGRDPKGGAS
jgi:heterodisulfide reductase subunit C2